jgi:molybdopterin-guanine dinucleotide biosynthesis protein A
MRHVRLTGWLLVGGLGRRFGSEKHRIRLGRETLLDLNLRLLRSVADEVGVVVNAEQTGLDLGKARLVTDIHPRIGPLGGILTGLVNSRTKYNLFIACDMPFLTKKTLTLLGERCAGHDVTIPCRGERCEPLVAVYSKACLDVIEAQRKNGRYRLLDLLPKLKVGLVRDPLFETDAKIFTNINTPQEYAEARRRTAKSRRRRQPASAGGPIRP